MYAEITKQAFNSLLINEQVTKLSDYESLEHYNKMYYEVLGITLLQIDNFLTMTSQYYIQDINS